MKGTDAVDREVDQQQKVDNWIGQSSTKLSRGDFMALSLMIFLAKFHPETYWYCRAVIEIHEFDARPKARLKVRPPCIGDTNRDVSSITNARTCQRIVRQASCLLRS